MPNYHYVAPSAPEDFARADILGWNSTNNVVRRIQPGDNFAGHVLDTFDRTGLANGINTHAQPLVGTISVVVGTLEIKPAAGVTPQIGEKVFAASPTTFSHDPLAGTYFGILIKPWLEHGGVNETDRFWIVDTFAGFVRAISESKFLLGSIIVGTEAADVIPVTLQVETRAGTAVTEAVVFEISLRNSVSLEPVLAAAFTATVTTGTLQSGSTSARPFVKSDALGVIVLDVTDVIGASGSSLVMVSDWGDSTFPATGIKIAHTELITFD